LFSHNALLHTFVLLGGVLLAATATCFFTFSSRFLA
jgi:hypothetical protein